MLESRFSAKFRPTTLSDLESRLLREGNGATGVVYGAPPAGSRVGHVFNVVNQNGVIRYLDGQTGRPAVTSPYPSFQYLPLPRIGN